MLLIGRRLDQRFGFGKVSVCSFEGTILDSSMVEHSAVNRRVAGSSPARGGWEWLRGQAVKTSPFHGGNTGSIPVGVSKLWCHSQVVRRGTATP